MTLAKYDSPHIAFTDGTGLWYATRDRDSDPFQVSEVEKREANIAEVSIAAGSGGVIGICYMFQLKDVNGVGGLQLLYAQKSTTGWLLDTADPGPPRRRQVQLSPVGNQLARHRCERNTPYRVLQRCARTTLRDLAHSRPKLLGVEFVWKRRVRRHSRGAESCQDSPRPQQCRAHCISGAGAGADAGRYAYDRTWVRDPRKCGQLGNEYRRSVDKLRVGHIGRDESKRLAAYSLWFHTRCERIDRTQAHILDELVPRSHSPTAQEAHNTRAAKLSISHPIGS
jgi:hypothetical protein